MLDNKDLYPTPQELAFKMLSKVKLEKVKTILEPSAGFGNLINAIKEFSRYKQYDISAIEIDNRCRSYLLGEGINVIDSDFLFYNGIEQFDLILANFPFSDGDRHLHKAIDILFNGQIVCLINAETLKNPYTSSRKELVNKLNSLNAEIEYIKNAFMDAERKTSVEVALIYLEKTIDVDKDIFENIKDDDDQDIDIDTQNEIATMDDISNILIRYETEKELITNQILSFYKNHKKVSKYIDLSVIGEDMQGFDREKKIDDRELSAIMKSKLNYFAKKIKKDYWLSTMKLDQVNNMLTSKKKKELSTLINQYTNMSFTKENIKIFIENLKVSYPSMIDEAINDIFDSFTKYAFREDSEYRQNIYLYNGWKTNEAYKVNKKVILPFYIGWSGINSLSFEQQEFLDDIDMVFNYFDEKNTQNELLEYDDRSSFNKRTLSTKQTAEIVKVNLQQGNTKNIKTRYFTITVYKKGTMHIVFNNLEMLRKVNIYVAKKRNWLPNDYGHTKAQSFDGFESKKEYKQIGTELAVGFNSVLMLTA